MRTAHRGRSLQALVVASCLLASLSAVGGELRLERVTLSVEARPRGEGTRVEARPSHLPPEGVVLPLRVVDPGRLVVAVGEQRLTDCHLGFGEAGSLLVGPLEDDSPLALPRVVNREPGKEEVEVHLPASVVAGQRLVLTYEWGWKHEGKSPLVRTWHLPAPARATGLDAFALNGKAYLQRALDTLEPLAASPAGQGLAATVRALREASRHAFFDASRVHDAQLLERTLRLREELQRLWPSGTERPAAVASALSDLLLLVQQAAFVSLSDARLLFGAPPSAVHAARAAKGTPAFREAERAWEEASQQLARGQEQQAGPSLLRAWREALEAMSLAGVHFRPGEVSDVDGDGVPDQLEVRFGASPLSVDTDGDGLTDGFELRWGGAHLLPASADTDGDGTADGAEDLDGDGRTSLQEQARGTDPLLADTPRVDALATAPRKSLRPAPKVLTVALPNTGKSQPSGAPPDPFDTDGDGLDDVAELANGTPPDVADWDGDGLSDSQELEHLSDPDVADTDGDGFSDAYEVMHLGDGLDPLAPDERLSPQQWARDYAQALTLGDTCDTALSGWKPCKTTVPFFLGQLSGGTASFIPVVGWVVGGLADVRDAVGSAVKGEWAGAGLSVLGVLPVVGDVSKLVGRVVEFTKRHGKLEEVLRAVLRALPKLLGLMPEKVDAAARELVLAVLRKVDPEGFQSVAKYGGDEFLLQVAKLGGKWKNLAQLFTGLEKSGLFTQYPRMKEFLEEMIRTTPEAVLYGRGQVLRLNGRVTLSVKKSALRPKNGPRYLENIRKHLSSALAEHRSLRVLPGDGEDLIKVGHVASHGPDRVLRSGPFIDVLEVKAFGNVGLSHLGKWIGKRPDPKNPGKFIYEFDGDMLERHLRAAKQPVLRELLDDHTLRYHLFIYAPDTALTRELTDLFTSSTKSISIKGREGKQIILTMTRHWD